MQRRQREGLLRYESRHHCCSVEPLGGGGGVVVAVAVGVGEERYREVAEIYLDIMR